MLGTLVELQDPVPRLRAELRRRTGVDVGDEAAARGFAAEISYYLDHHMEGRDRSRSTTCATAARSAWTRRWGPTGCRGRTSGRR